MYQNATREQIIEALKAGKSNTAISRELRADKARVRQIRAELGVEPHVHIPQPLTLEEKWAVNTRPVDGGHLEWTGERRTASRTPVLRYWPKTYSPAAIAFRMKHGRDPEGQVYADCGMKQCVAPDHVDDVPGRLAKRAALRQAKGVPERQEQCRYGHDQSVHGRFERDGRPYCEACKADAKHADPEVLAARAAVRQAEWDTIADLLRQGMPQIQVARQVGVAWATVQRVRLELGLPAQRAGRPDTYASLEDAFHSNTERLPGGHLRWIGVIDGSRGGLIVCFRKERLSASKVAFRLWYGREPVGRALSTCGVQRCVEGAHLADRPMREANRRADAAFAKIFGMAS